MTEDQQRMLARADDQDRKNIERRMPESGAEGNRRSSSRSIARW